LSSRLRINQSCRHATDISVRARHAQNRQMMAALTEKGYEVNFVWGRRSHSGKPGGAILPEMVATFGEMDLSEALNQLDGRLALRELQGGASAGWR